MPEGQPLQIHSMFYTLQGEGPFAGAPALFIRLAGCNLQCPNCDTEYTEGRTTESSRDVFNRAVSMVQDLPLRPIVVLTGGEPFRQDIRLLCDLLIDEGFTVQVETNGTLYREVHPDVVIVCSPKTGSINKKLLPRIAALKYVLTPGSVDPDDGLPLLVLGHPASPKVARPPEGFKGTVYVQPVDTGWSYVNGEAQKLAVRTALKHGYRLCLQIHKTLGLE